MFNWFNGVEPAEWAAIVAAFIAAASFVSQAASGRRQARLTLLEKRLEAVQPLFMALAQLQALAGNPQHTLQPQALNEAIDQVRSAVPSYASIGFIFGRDVEIIGLRSDAVMKEALSSITGLIEAVKSGEDLGGASNDCLYASRSSRSVPMTC